MAGFEPARPMSKDYVVPLAFVTYFVKPQRETMKLEGKTFTLALPDCATPTITLLG